MSEKDPLCTTDEFISSGKKLQTSKASNSQDPSCLTDGSGGRVERSIAAWCGRGNSVMGPVS